MRNVVVGSFVGFVLAAAFLAACGGSAKEDAGGGPVPISTPSQAKWSALGPTQSVVTGITLSRDDVWTSSSSYDNATASNRHQYAAFEISGNVESFVAGDVTVDVGVLAAPGGTSYATDPQWLGTVTMATASNRRAVLSNVRIPPTPCKFALRLRYGASASVRVTAFTMTPYDEELQ